VRERSECTGESFDSYFLVEYGSANGDWSGEEGLKEGILDPLHAGFTVRIHIRIVVTQRLLSGWCSAQLQNPLCSEM
jgi:hypothetical protein